MVKVLSVNGKIPLVDGKAISATGGGGLSKTEKSLILTLFKNAMYTGNMTDTVTALENMWSGSGGGEEIVTYTITNTLSNVTSNNSATSATAGSSYSATLTANDGYTINTVTVLMGGVDVTDSVYSNGSITIGSVTGNVSITATAVEASSAANWEHGVAYTFTELVANESVRETDGSFITYDGYTRTGYIPCYGAGWIAVDEKATIYGVFYDTNKNFVKGFRIYGPSAYMTVPENAAYFACCASTGLTYTITPYRREEATWEDGVPYTLTFIENSYVDNTNGTFIDYNGWKRTDYLNCVGASKITLAKQLSYGAFYNVDKVYMKGWLNRTEIDVPDGVCYFIASGSNADMDAQTIIPTA